MSETYLERQDRMVREKAVKEHYANQARAHGAVEVMTDIQDVLPEQRDPEAPRGMPKEECFWIIVIIFASILDNNPSLFKKLVLRCMATCPFYQTTLTAAADATTGKRDRFIAHGWPQIFTCTTAFKIFGLVEVLKKADKRFGLTSPGGFTLAPGVLMNQMQLDGWLKNLYMQSKQYSTDMGLLARRVNEYVVALRVCQAIDKIRAENPRAAADATPKYKRPTFAESAGALAVLAQRDFSQFIQRQHDEDDLSVDNDEEVGGGDDDGDDDGGGGEQYGQEGDGGGGEGDGEGGGGEGDGGGGEGDGGDGGDEQGNFVHIQKNFVTPTATNTSNKRKRDGSHHRGNAGGGRRGRGNGVFSRRAYNQKHRKKGLRA